MGVGTPKDAATAAAADVFFRVSVSAAKVSALDKAAVRLTESSDSVERPPTESEEGDLDLRGRGAGTGGLLASAPAGKSITRSGV